MKIESLKLSDLNPAKYNPRKELKPGDTDFEKLKRPIESFGYVELIVVNEATGFTVISGHQRLSVLKALGYGHFNSCLFPWENTNMYTELRKAAEQYADRKTKN